MLLCAQCFSEWKARNFPTREEQSDWRSPLDGKTEHGYDTRVIFRTCVLVRRVFCVGGVCGCFVRSAKSMPSIYSAQKILPETKKHIHTHVQCVSARGVLLCAWMRHVDIHGCVGSYAVGMVSGGWMALWCSLFRIVIGPTVAYATEECSAAQNARQRRWNHSSGHVLRSNVIQYHEIGGMCTIQFRCLWRNRRIGDDVARNWCAKAGTCRLINHYTHTYTNITWAVACGGCCVALQMRTVWLAQRCRANISVCHSRRMNNKHEYP